MPPRPFLRALADRIGILPSYVDASGRTRRTADSARVALLAAMGIDAASEARAREQLETMRARTAAALIPPARVAQARAARHVPLAVPARAWTVELTREDGIRLRVGGVHRRGARRSIALPPLPLGYHRLRVTVTLDDGGERAAEQQLIVVPARCPTAGERLGARRVYGILANLYTVRGARNWGFGDLSDLTRLIDWAAARGAAFVGINPLHALDNRGEQISPYSPVSRLYRNVLYLDVPAVPEWRGLSDAQRRALSRDSVLGPLRAAERIDYAAVRAVKESAFSALYRVFAARARGTARGNAYQRFLAAQGAPLRRFAAFLALQTHVERCGVTDWRRWPAAFRQPESASVREFCAAEADAIERHCYLQFELDRQLEGAAQAARAGGMELGVYQDLALGSSRQGSDPWAFPGLFLDGVDLGAPPDPYAPTGQNWSLPPIDPRALAASGYEYWARLVRAALRHAGALRIDHVMGLFRQFWIAAGARGRDGAYVRQPAAELLGILALESQRAGALVIGEDLGTVPRGLPARLARAGILSTRVLYFERDRRGGFRPARAYPRRALVGANTHDLEPLAGFWEGRDLPRRRALGLLADDRALARARSARERERRALLRRLRREGVLPRGSAPDGAALRAAVHAFLARTPAVLLGISLDDLTGEVTPVNQPGVALARHPSWTRRMRLPLEALAKNADVARALGGLRARGQRGQTELTDRGTRRRRS